MPPRRRRGGGTTGGNDGGSSGSTPTRRPDSTGGGGADVDPAHLDTMAGRLDQTQGRVGDVRTRVGAVSVGPQSFGIVGQGFAGPANQHLQDTQTHFQRTEDAVGAAQQGTRTTAQGYRDTEATNVENLNRIQSDSTPPQTTPAATTEPRRSARQQQQRAQQPPATTTPASTSTQPRRDNGQQQQTQPPPQTNPGDGTGPTEGAPRVRRRRKDPNRPANADELRENRPSIRKKTKFQVYKNAQRAPNGNLICPSTGEEIPVKRGRDGKPELYNERGQKDPNGFSVPEDNPRSGEGDAVYHFGHVPDSEYHRLMKLIEDNPGQYSQKQILDEYNQASHYSVESPSANVGHSHESTAPGYGHYQGLADQPGTATQPTAATPPAAAPPAAPPPAAPPPATTPPTGPQQQPPTIRRRR